MPRRKTKKEPEHIHRYERTVLGKDYVVMRCNLPACNHYIPKKLARGKVALCNRCENPFILDAAALMLLKPHCTDCIERKKPQIRDIADLFRDNA